MREPIFTLWDTVKSILHGVWIAFIAWMVLEAARKAQTDTELAMCIMFGLLIGVLSHQSWWLKKKLGKLQAQVDKIPCRLLGCVSDRMERTPVREPRIKRGGRAIQRGY